MAETVDPAGVPVLDPDVFWIEVEGEVVAVQGRMRVVHLVSETGALLWPFLDGQASIEALAADVADAFGVPAERALADVATFVDEMQRAGLVTFAEPDGSRADR